MSGRSVTRAALATALASVAVLHAVPLLLGVRLVSFESAAALAATVIALEALAVAPRVLPASVALYATGIVTAVHRGDAADWSVAPLAVALLVLVESAELRHRLPPECVVERSAVHAQLRQLLLVAGAGLAASAVALAAAGLSSRGGAGAGIVGGAAIVATLLLIRRLAGASGGSASPGGT
jgi:hypothetical protein